MHFLIVEFKHPSFVGDLLGVDIELEGHVLDNGAIYAHFAIPNGLLDFRL
jgi:hypothetical protein